MDFYDEMWHEASRDVDRDAEVQRDGMARQAARSVWPFIALANDESDLNVRLALAQDGIAAAADAHGVEARDVVASLSSDWRLIREANDADQDQDDDDKDQDDDGSDDDDDDDSDDDGDQDDDGVDDDSDNDGGSTFDPDNDGDDDSSPETDTDNDGGSGKPWEKSSARQGARFPVPVTKTAVYSYDEAVEIAREHGPIQKKIVSPEYWSGHTIVRKDDGTHAVYSGDAWDEPTEQPMLPWHPPTGTPVAHVDNDGNVTRIPSPHTAAFGQFDREDGEESEDHCAECGESGGYGQPGGECEDCMGRNDAMGICPTCTPHSERSDWENEHLLDMRKSSARQGAGFPDAVTGAYDPKNDPASWQWDQQAHPGGPLKGSPDDLFPNGIPLHGDLTPEQQAWLDGGKKKPKTAMRSYACDSCGHEYRASNMSIDSAYCPSCGSENISSYPEEGAKTAAADDRKSHLCTDCMGSGKTIDGQCPVCLGKGVLSYTTAAKDEPTCSGCGEQYGTSQGGHWSESGWQCPNCRSASESERFSRHAVEQGEHNWKPWQYEEPQEGSDVRETPNGMIGEADVVTADEGITDKNLAQPQTYQQQIRSQSAAIWSLLREAAGPLTAHDALSALFAHDEECGQCGDTPTGHSPMEDRCRKGQNILSAYRSLTRSEQNKTSGKTAEKWRSHHIDEVEGEGQEYEIAPQEHADALNKRFGRGSGPVVWHPKQKNRLIHSPNNFWDGPTHVDILRDGNYGFHGYSGAEKFDPEGRTIETHPGVSSWCPDCNGKGDIWGPNENYVHDPEHPYGNFETGNTPYEKKGDCQSCSGTGSLRWDDAVARAQSQKQSSKTAGDYASTVSDTLNANQQGRDANDFASGVARTWNENLSTKPRQLPGGGEYAEGDLDFDPTSEDAAEKDEPDESQAQPLPDRSQVVSYVLRHNPHLSLPEAREIATRAMKLAYPDARNFGSNVPVHDGPITEMVKHLPEKIKSPGGSMPGMPEAPGIGGGAGGAGEAAGEAGEAAGAAEDVAQVAQVAKFLA